ncbi:MarR family winged helix-turn-helix transcriptional regulator [Caulobacter sp. KR2-114]|uniref:MarR family winged helix-turn-helix transcriptional regulator n=1 Tax=Caulobacter sp. KR2-114 TaxID=3400912 RepID=UPI003BFC48D5
MPPADDRPTPDTPVAEGLTADESGGRYLIYLLSVFEALRLRELETELRPLSMSVSRNRVLGWLSVNAEATMTQLSRGSMIERTTLTRLLDPMVRDGLVERVRSDADRREIFVRITATGLEHLRRSVLAANGVNDRYRGVLTADEIRAATAVLLKLLSQTRLDDQTFAMLTRRERRRPGQTEGK